MTRTETNDVTGKVFLVVGSVMTWFALGAQLYIVIERTETGLGDALLKYFGFFTILTNLLVAFCLTAPLIPGTSKAVRFWEGPRVVTAVMTYIVMVGIIYNGMLRGTWDPQGLQRPVDELLHVVIPVVFCLYWYYRVPKAELRLKDIPAWLVYPVGYLGVTLVKGAWLGWYPYPFINVVKLGYVKVLSTSGVMLVAYLLLAIGVVVVVRLQKGKVGEAQIVDRKH